MKMRAAGSQRDGCGLRIRRSVLTLYRTPIKYKDQSEKYISLLSGPTIILKTQAAIPSGAQRYRRPIT